MKTKIIAILVVASVMLVFGIQTASALNLEVYCWDKVPPVKSCCYGSDVGSVYCYVDSSGCTGSGIDISCGSTPSTPGNYLSNAKKYGVQQAGCIASGEDYARAWCSSSSCGCEAGY